MKTYHKYSKVFDDRDVDDRPSVNTLDNTNYLYVHYVNTNNEEKSLRKLLPFYIGISKASETSPTTHRYRFRNKSYHLSKDGWDSIVEQNEGVYHSSVFLIDIPDNILEQVKDALVLYYFSRGHRIINERKEPKKKLPLSEENALAFLYKVFDKYCKNHKYRFKVLNLNMYFLTTNGRNYHSQFKAT